MKEKPRFLQSKSHFEKSKVAIDMGFSVLEGASGDGEIGVASLDEDGESLKEAERGAKLSALSHPDLAAWKQAKSLM